MTIKKDDIKTPFINNQGFVISKMMGKSDEPIQTENFSFCHISIPAGKKGALHSHKKAEEVHYVVSGNGIWSTGEKSFELSNGMAITFKPGEKHQVINSGNEPLEFIEFSTPASDKNDRVDY